MSVLSLQNGSVTPEKKSQSRPTSFAGAESPNLRSSTSESLKNSTLTLAGSNYRQMPPPPPPQSRKPNIGQLSIFYQSGKFWTSFIFFLFSLLILIFLIIFLFYIFFTVYWKFKEIQKICEFNFHQKCFLIQFVN